MTTEGVVLRGTIQPDGKLDLAGPIGLPPGPVEVRVTPAPVNKPTGETVWEVLDRIHAEQQARGFVGRTREEIDADINSMRDEWEEHQHAIERLQEECWKAREKANEAQGTKE